MLQLKHDSDNTHLQHTREHLTANSNSNSNNFGLYKRRTDNVRIRDFAGTLPDNYEVACASNVVELGTK